MRNSVIDLLEPAAECYDLLAVTYDCVSQQPPMPTVDRVFAWCYTRDIVNNKERKMEKNWTVTVYKRDGRCKLGERKVAKYPFVGMDRDTVERELRELSAQLYPERDGWRFDVQPRYVTVKNLMSGEDVLIEAEQRGGPCDPSTERYWSM